MTLHKWYYAWLPQIEQAAKRFEVPTGLLVAVVRQESAWDGEAYSHADAAGPMQFIASTARAMGITNRYDYKQSIAGGAKYLSDLYSTFGRWDYALAAYNAGPGAVRRYGGVPPYRETENYVRLILQHWEKIR